MGLDITNDQNGRVDVELQHVLSRRLADNVLASKKRSQAGPYGGQR